MKKADPIEKTLWDFGKTTDEPRYYSRMVENRDDLENFLDQRLKNHLKKTDSGVRNPYELGSYLFSEVITALADCRERSHYITGLFLALDVYDFVCFRQLQLFDDAIKTYTPADAFKISRLHKGHLLWEIVKMLDSLGFEWLKQRYVVLTLIEDMLSWFHFSEYGKIEFSDEANTIFFKKDPNKQRRERAAREMYEKTGVVALLVREYQMTIEDLMKLHEDFLFAMEHFRFFSRQKIDADQDEGWPIQNLLFPEWFAGNADIFLEFRKRTSPKERDFYVMSRTYYNWCWNLIAMSYEINDKRIASNRKGRFFEEACRYIMSCVPGIRVMPNSLGPAGQADLIIIIDDMLRDFRDEFGSNILAECKSGKDGGSKSNVSELIGKSLLFKSHIFFSLQKTTSSGNILEHISLMNQGNAFVHFDLDVLAPIEFLKFREDDVETGGSTQSRNNSRVTTDQIFKKFSLSFQEQIKDKSFSLSDLRLKLRARDFLLEWKREYEKSKLALFKRPRKRRVDHEKRKKGNSERDRTTAPFLDDSSSKSKD